MLPALWIFVKAFLVVFGFVFILSMLQFLLSIHPPRHHDDATPEQYGLPFERVAFRTADRIEIRGWLIPSAAANGTVIIGHGYPFDKGNILHVTSFLYPEYNLLYYDHRYFGESSGLVTTVGIKEAEDVRAAVAFARKRFGNNASVALYGFSLSAAAMMMSRAEVNAIIADSGYANLENMVKHVYKLFGPLKLPFVHMTNLLSVLFFGKHPRAVSPAAAGMDSDVPILVIHGDQDTQIPVRNAHQLKKANPRVELWIAKGSDHGQAHALYPDEYEQRVKDFLGRNMKRQV